MPVCVGDKLGPYEILASIGAGGMGEVWKARDIRLDRIVAIKTLKGGDNARFQQEARAVAALNHPYICQIYDVGPDFLVMEYIDGQPLCGPLPFEEVMRIAIQIASALEAAHEKKILHRDLKPANVLISRSGAKLLDFGLAKMNGFRDEDATLKTVAGTILGTVAWMSPEQAQGQPVDERSDIFSFGAVLYELFSGKRAFAGNSMAEVLSAVIRDDPPPFESPATAIVSRCLSKQAGGRFQNVTELKSALEQLATAGSRSPIPQHPTTQPSIAVLPFANISSDRENDYFSDGLAEEILNALAQVNDLKVIARTSSFAFRGKDVDIRTIAAALDVGAVLEGSVRKSGNRIRITAQLINAADGAHLWSARYDREMIDVFAIQDEISSAIIGVLKAKLMPGGRVPAAPTLNAPTSNIDAYDAFLKGRHHLNLMGLKELDRAQAYFKEAIALDANCAAAWAGLARCYIALAMERAELPAHEMIPLAREAALRAVQLDDALASGHVALAQIAAQYDWDWAEALRRYRLATERAITSAELALCVIWILTPLHRFDEAIAAGKSAATADPLAPLPGVARAFPLMACGSYEEAISQLRRVTELHENFWLAWVYLGVNYTVMGRTADAIHALEKCPEISAWHRGASAFLAWNYRVADDTDKAQVLIDRFGADRVFKTWFSILSGEIAIAAERVELMIAARDTGVILLNCFPVTSEFRKYPRVGELLRGIGLPD